MDIKTTLDLDLAMSGYQLEQDDTVQTAVILSLFSDAPGEMDGQTFRGWWGDGVSTLEGDTFGSSLWTFARAKRTQETLRSIESAAQHGLQWLLAEGHVTAIAITAAFGPNAAIVLDVSLTAPGTQQQSFQLSWVF